MSFARLPAELQIHIFSYLQAPELKAVRAVCTQFRDNASIWLFRQVIACARYPVMGVFQRITNHAVYSTCVKEIVFDGTVFSADLARSESLYQHAANHFEDLTSLWAKRRGFVKYKSFFQEQEDIINGHVLLQTIARALEWQLFKVSSLVYSPVPHELPIERKDMFEVVPRGRTYWQVAHEGFHHMVGAIHTAQFTGIRHLKIERRPPHIKPMVGTEFFTDVFLFRDPTHIEAGKFLFRNLRTVDIVLRISPLHDHIPSRSHDARSLGNIAVLLTEAKDLESLFFEFTPWHPEPRDMYADMVPNGRPIFSYLGLEHTWPRLRSVRLGGVSVDEEQVRSLLRRHETTLRSVEFKCCALITGTWSNIIDEVIPQAIITKFLLERVIDLTARRQAYQQIGQVPSSAEAKTWEYEGQLIVNNEGERCFTHTQR